MRPGVVGALRTLWPFGQPAHILGSGLLLLSKHNWIAPPRLTRFKRERGFVARLTNLDVLSAKGMASCVIAPSGEVPWGIFLIHAQADYASRKHREARRKQLQSLAAEVQRFWRTQQPCIAVCLGDLNVVAGGDEWREMLALTGLEDPFPTGSSTALEFTYDGELNSLVTQFAPQNANVRERLDYVLVGTAGTGLQSSVQRSYIDPERFRAGNRRDRRGRGLCGEYRLHRFRSTADKVPRCARDDGALLPDAPPSSVLSR